MAGLFFISYNNKKENDIKTEKIKIKDFYIIAHGCYNKLGILNTLNRTWGKL